MEEHVATHREEVRRLVFRYRKDIVYLEEKEEDLVRRIQILENLIPTVLVWYMWKAKNDVQYSQLTEEEAKNKLNHLETILKELQTADQIMKKEETVLRKRIEELEESLDKDLFANIYIKQSSPLQSLTHDQVKSEIAVMNRKINKMNEKRLQFVDFLQDSDRDWQKTCEELVNEVNNLKDILDQSNVKSKDNTIHTNRVGRSNEKDDVINGKINYLENQTKLLYGELIEQEQRNIAREESHDEKVFSMVQDAMDEVDSLKQVLKDSNKEKRVGVRAPKDVGFKKPVIHMIAEEEEKEEAETDLGEANSPVVYPLATAENKPSPLVLDFQDKAFSAESSKQKINAALTSPEEAKESFIKRQTASSYKSIDKRSTVEAVTTTDIQLPPSAQVDQLLQIGKLATDNLSLQSTSSSKASDSSVDKIFPDNEKLPSESDLPLTITSQTFGDKHTDPTKSHSFTGDLPNPVFLESREQMPFTPVRQKQGLDSPHSQMATISSFSESSPEKSPSEIVSPKPTVSKTSPNQMPLPEKATIQASLPETTDARTLTSPDAAFPETISPRTETDASKAPQTDWHKTVTSHSMLSTVTPEFIDPPPTIQANYPLPETASTRIVTAVTNAPQEQTALSTVTSEFAQSPPTILSESLLPEKASPRTATAVTMASQEQTDLHKTVISQSASSTPTPEFVLSPPTILSESPLPETASPRTATVVTKAPSHQASEPRTVVPQSHLPEATSSSNAKTTSLRINKIDSPYEQAGPSTATPTKSSSPEGYSETVSPPSIIPAGPFSEATSLRTETAVSKAPSNQTGLIDTASNKPYPTDTASKTVSPPLQLPTTTPNIADQYDPVMSSEPSAKHNLGKTGGNTAILEPYEVPNTDGDFPTSSGAQQGQDNLRSQPDRENLADHTLQSKCRVKDHLIKTLADQLREQARSNVGSGDKLLSAISRDPVKTYDFDRHTLAKYLKGEGPKDIDVSLRSEPAYSNTNQLKVEVLQKLDQSSLIIKWGPAPPQEVVGFQIFVDGEFMYWVHSATRSMALLQPLDLSKKLEIAVSPVDSKGTIILRSSVTYTPEL